MSHHIQTNGLAEDAVDICYDSSKVEFHKERYRERKRERRIIELGEERKKKGAEEERGERGEREKDIRKTMEETIGREERGKNIREGKRGKRSRRGLGECCAGPSRMTIISGHWVHGAWRLSFAPYSYACPSCLSKPSLF